MVSLAYKLANIQTGIIPFHLPVAAVMVQSVGSVDSRRGPPWFWGLPGSGACRMIDR